MTTSKWPLRLAKLALMGWLIANTGMPGYVVKNWEQHQNKGQAYYDSLYEIGGGLAIWEQQVKLNNFIIARADSVKAMIANGHRYQTADYFRDLKDVWDYADVVTPWSRSTITISKLTNLQDREESLSSIETSALRCELLGIYENDPGPTDWNSIFGWLFRQYWLGFLPALIMCLILAKQGRIKWSLRKLPASSILYLALWPVNFFARAIYMLQELHHEARLRTHMDSLFSKLSGLEEGFLVHLRERNRKSDLQQVLGRESFQLRYLLAIFAVVIIRIMPSIAHEAEQSIVSEQNIEVSNHGPPIAFASDESDHEDHVCFFAWKDYYDKALRRIVWWPSLEVFLLFGYRTCLEHVPLGKTDRSSVRLTQN